MADLRRQEALLIRNVRKPSWNWPTCLKCPPWRIEEDSHPQSKHINEILQASLDFQRSTCPPIMPDYICDEESFFIVGFMRHILKAYLASIGDTESKLDINCGSLPKGMYPNDVYLVNDLMKCWLELNGQIIQPDFVHGQEIIGLQSIFKGEHFKK